MNNNLEEINPIIIPEYEEEEKQRKLLKAIKPKKSKNKRSNTSKNEKEKKSKVLLQTPSLLPFIDATEVGFVMKTGVMDIFQRTTKDLYSLNQQELQTILYADTSLLRSYFDSFKKIAINFPANTSMQQKYWEKKLDNAKTDLIKRFCERKLFELKFLEKERSHREFFYFIYADTFEQLKEKKKTIIRLSKKGLPLKEISPEKKQDILFLLNNQNTKL